MRVLKALLEITVYSWILFAAIMLIKKLVKKHSSPALQYLVWFLFLARLCIPATLDSGVHLFVIAEFGTSTEQSIHTSKLNSVDSHRSDAIPMKTASMSEQAQGDQVAKKHDPELGPESAILSSNPTGIPTMKVDWYQVAMGLWLVGIAGVLSFFVMTSLKMSKKIKNTTITPSEKIIAMLEYCKRELHIKKPIAIHVIEEITTPALTVSWSPKLLFPAHMIGTMKDEQILFALRHELTHFKRKDHLVSLLLRVLEAVYWFNPIVWIASQKISMDMESAYDSRVVQAMEKAEKSYYASTILEMFSRDQSPQFILGMAMMGTRDVAEKRIRGIYMKGRTKLRVRFLVIALAAVLILSCFTTACQPTPEDPVVVGKGDSKLEKIIAGPPVSTELAKPYEAPAKLNYKLEATDVFSVDVDANVLVPDVDAYPVVPTQKDTITQKQADKFIKVLLEGRPLYWPNEELTKDQIQNSIDYYKNKLDMVDANEMDSKIRKDLIEASGDYLSPDALSPEEQKELYKGKIKELMKAYESAPDQPEQKLAKRKFDFLGLTKDEIKQAKADKHMSIVGVTPLEPGKRQMLLLIDKWGEDGGSPQVAFWEYQLEGLSYPYNGIDHVTLEQAIHKGEQLMEDLDLDFSLVQSRTMAVMGELGEVEKYHELIFKRRIYGVSQSNAFTVFQSDQHEFYSSYEDESIIIEIDDYGLRTFFWNEPSKLGDALNANVPLLPFEEIKEIFDRQILLRNQWGYPEEEVISRRLIIDHVELSYMKVRKPNDDKEFIYLPVWDFYGKLMAKYGEDYPAGTEGFHILDENNERVMKELTTSTTDLSFLTINAIDGSIIDRNMGY